MRVRRDPPWAWLLAALGALVYLRVFHTFFAQDDFGWLWRAAHGAPESLLAPRFLSTILYFEAFWRLFGFRPEPYHAFNLALHLATGLLVYQVIALRLPRFLAAAAAAVFLSSPALFDALHWVSAVSDVLCGFLLLLALWLLAGGGRSRMGAAVACYGLAIMSKEIAVGAAPLLALLAWRRGAGGRFAAAAFLALAAAGVAIALGPRAVSAGIAYAVNPAASLSNLPGYLAGAVGSGLAAGWASDLSWSRQPAVQITGWALLLGWVSWLWVRRSKEAWLGFFWFAAVLAPVTLLERQFYFYYLYCALPGLLAAVAFLLGPSPRPLEARRKEPARAPRAVATLGALIALAQGVAVEARARAQFRSAPLPSDFVLRRAVTARNAMADLQAAAPALGPRVVMLGQQPVESSVSGITTTPETAYIRDPFWEDNVRVALADGLAIRLRYPVVREVEFVRWLQPADSAAVIVPYQIDGHLKVTDYAALAAGTKAAGGGLQGHLTRAGLLIERRLFAEAREELEAAYRLAPDHPDVVLNLSTLNAKLGDTAAAIRGYRRAVELSPQDAEALFDLGLLLWRSGRQAEARQTWAKLEALAPTSDLTRMAHDLMSGRQP